MDSGDTAALVVVGVVVLMAAVLREVTLRMEAPRPASPICPSCGQRSGHKLWCPYC